MNFVLLRGGWVLARFHRWAAAVFVFSLVRPLARWDERSKGYFGYACMMSAYRPETQKRFQELTARERDRSVEMNLWLARIAWVLGQTNMAVGLYRFAEISEPDSIQTQVARVMRLAAEGLHDGSIERAIAQAADKASLPDPGTTPVLITVLSYGYFDLYTWWLEQAKKHVPGHRLVLALDAAAKQKAEEAGASVIDLSSYFVFQTKEVITKYCRGLIWVMRVLVLRELAVRGYTIYSLDLDAMPVGNLAEMLYSFPKADIIAQKDYSIPMDVARDLGFVLCCGFMVFYPTKAALAFLDRYGRQTIQEMDDQLAINHLIQKDGVKGITKNQEYISFQASGLTWLCPDPSLVSRDAGHGKVIRHFQQHSQTVDDLKKIMGMLQEE